MTRTDFGADPARPQRGAVTVFGAYGHTGRFVVAELQRRGWTPVLAGRDEAKLREVAEWAQVARVHVATVDQPATLDDALSGASAVINCAGPFTESAPALIDAAVRAGIHYLDVTGESLVAKAVFERYSDMHIPDGMVIAPAMAFFGGLGDLLASAALQGLPTADEVYIAVALDGWKPTRGTMLAGERRAGRRVVFTAGELAVLPSDQPPPKSTWHFAEPFGLQEVVGEFTTVDVVTMSRHLQMRDIHAFVNLTPISDLTAFGGSGQDFLCAGEASRQLFLVEVEARAGEATKRVAASGRDIYGFTAPIVVAAAEWIIDGRTRASGLRAAGELFDAEAFLRSLPLESLTL